jgi:hypothetical protein
MKSIFLLILLITVLTNCQSEKTIQPVELAGCSDPRYTRAQPIQGVATVVIAQTSTTLTGSTVTNYYLDRPDIAGFSIPWVACNLPDAYKKHLLAVRIDGYSLTYLNMANENSNGNPIELTQIQIR